MSKPDDATSAVARRIAARTRSQSRNRAVSANDFEFGEELGEGSYSIVRFKTSYCLPSGVTKPVREIQVKQATHLRSGQEFAIKILDKAHLRRHNKLEIPLAEKNTLARLGSGHPGIARLHFTFQDEWSLCEFATVFRLLLKRSDLFIIPLQSLYWISQRMERCKLGYLGWDLYPLTVLAITVHK